jgi:hypothetical protein
MRDDYLRLQESWIALAHSFELAERLTNFSRDNEWRRAEFFGDDMPLDQAASVGRPCRD